jgi:hypothetical protein
MVAEDPIDELTYEPVQESEFDPAVGLTLESLRRRLPTMTIR